MRNLKYKNQGSIEFEIILYSHTGKKLDISYNISQFEIIEDVSNFCLVGSFMFIDVLGIKEFLPLIGGEKLKITYRTDETFDYVSNNFVITKIGKENQSGDYIPRKSLQVFFSSELIVNSFKQSFSKSYNHKQPSYIVKDIYDNMLKSKKQLIVEDTINTISYIIPNCNPHKAIQYIMKRSLSSTYNDAGYLFFENANECNFISLQKMYNQDAIFDIYFHKHFKNENERYTGYLGLPNYYENIYTIDLLEETRKGVYGSTIYVFDYAIGQFVKYSLNHQKTEKTNNIGNVIPIFSDYDAQESSIMEFTDYINDRLGNGVEYQKSIDEQAKIELRNRVLYGSLNKNAFVAGFYGNSDLVCGKIVNVDFKSQEDHQLVNEKMTGKYFIKAIRNKTTVNDGYSQIIMLTKPFYSADSDNIMKRV